MVEKALTVIGIICGLVAFYHWRKLKDLFKKGPPS